MENLEIRSFGGEASPKLVSEKNNWGYAVVVGQESKYMYDPVLRKCFIEIIEAGAVDEELIKRSDIRALEHNREKDSSLGWHGEADR